MSHFTQLNLQGSNSNSKTASNPSPVKPVPKKLGLKPEHGGAKVAAIVGSFMAATLIATFTIGTNGCSKSKPPVASNSSPSITQPVAATPAPTPSPAPVVAKQTKSPRQHKLATFKNKEYAISFRYPTHYTVKEGEETDTTQTTSAAMNFTQPGGTTLSTIELPEKLYTGTDFASAFFTVNVNPKMTADECSQFAFPEKTELDNNSDGPSKVNVAGKDYNEMNDVVSDGTMQANARYYHLYQNNVCYEFSLGLQTVSDETNKEMKPVNRDKVFDKLQWMLSTVKIKTTDAAPAVAKTTVEPSSTTESSTTASSTTQVITPNNQ